MQKHIKLEMSRKAHRGERNHSGNHCTKTISTLVSQSYILPLMLSIVILTSVGWYAWSSFKQLGRFESQRDEMAELRGTILHFDEVLTMSARMAAETGDLMWESRYLKHETQLDEAIQRLKNISQDTIKYKFAGKTDIANIELVALEKQAFNLVHQGSLQAAANLLNSQKYKELKLSYAEGMASLAVALHSSVKETHDKLHSRIIMAVLLSAIIVLLLSFGWISLIRINKRITNCEEPELFSSEPGKNKSCNCAATICSVGAVFVAVLGLIGWIPSLSFLGNISPHFIPMAPTTSICFILLGLIVLIQTRYQLRRWNRFSAVAVTLLLSVFGIIELAEYFHTGFDIEDIFLPNAGMLGLMRKARMSPATGATFFFSCIATLLVLLGETKKRLFKRFCRCSGIVGSLVVITGVTVLMGYLYQKPLLYGSQTIPMAATTAIGFVFLGIGLVAAAGPSNQPVRLLAGHSSRAKLLRVFLPLSILTVFGQDILHRFVVGDLHINSVLLSALSLMFFMAITGIVVTVMASVIGRALDTAVKKNKMLSKFPQENPNPVLRISKDGEVLYSNKAGEQLLEKWQSEIGQTVPEKWCNLITKAFSSGKGTEEEEEEEVKGIIFSVVIAPVKEAGYVNLYASSITARKLAEESLRESEEQFRTLVANIPGASYRCLVDEHWTMLFISDEVEKITGYPASDFIQNRRRSYASVIHPEDSVIAEKVTLDAVARHETHAVEYRVRRKDGKLCWVFERGHGVYDNQGKPIYLDGVIIDITDRKQAQKEKEQLQVQLRQTQKMEAIGTLAGGIAHDFNNILAALIGYADLAKDDIPEGTLPHQNLQEVLISANRAKELVKQILTFSRKDDIRLAPVQINSIVKEALKMLRSSLPTTIEINQDINCNNAIMADETHIHQILMNLGTNAGHAMEQYGGVLEVSLTDVNIDSDIITIDGLMKQGSYVKLSVKDTGCGMSKEVQERIFEPFYTTKEVGEGTGLGFSVVHGIVENHNGLITVDSKRGKGTTFEIFFPCVEEIAIKETEDSEVINGHGERILLVDDEHSLVGMTTQMLNRIGYEVVGKTSSIEALEVFQEDPDKFDLVITDQTMPKMKGTKLAEELMNIRADIPIVLCTGYSETVNEESVKAIGIKELVMKPVNRKEISNIIREILDKKEVTV